jgi:hypothetical protein
MSTISKNSWTAEITTPSDPQPPLHWACENLQHDNHKFARRIFINKVIITRGEVVEELKYGDFSTFSYDEIVKDKVIQDAYKDLFEYGTSFDAEKLNISEALEENGMQRYIYVSNHNFDGYGVSGPVYSHVHRKTSSTPPLFVLSALTFGKYGTNPPHEFSGMLEAARFVPTIYFATQDPSITSIRFDFRFELNLDKEPTYMPSFEWMDFSKLFPDAVPPRPDAVNYASIIRDNDTLPLASCLNELLRLVGEMMQTEKAIQKELGVFKELAFQVTSKFAASQISDLTESTIRLATLSGKMIALVSGILVELLKLPGCLTADAIQMIFDTAEVLDEEGKLLVEKILTMFRSVGNILDNYLDILSTITADGLDEVITYGEIILNPWETEKILKKRDRRRAITSRNIQKLRAENAELLNALKTDAVKVLDQFIFIAAKIFNYVSFEAAEKPVCYEVVGKFIDHGQVDDTWDNLHWWGTTYLPSAPGAFRAVHQHFRWSKFLGDPSPAEAKANDILFKILGGGAKPNKSYKSTAPFRSLVTAFKDRKIGGPLIDPGLPDQTIQFAIAKRDGALDKAILGLDPKQDFVDVASTIPKPQEIAKEKPQTGNVESFDGGDIVYWLSLRADRNKSEEIFRGSLLINGFYFAHSPEPDASFLGSTPTNFAAITQNTSYFNPPYKKPVKVFRKPK